MLKKPADQLAVANETISELNERERRKMKEKEEK